MMISLVFVMMRLFISVYEGVSEPTSLGHPMITQQALTITEELIQRVEVVYVLGLFLLGKHRKKVGF